MVLRSRSSIEYGGKWKHLQYHARRFYAPQMILVAPAYKDNSTLEVWAVNDADAPLVGTATVENRLFEGGVLATHKLPMDVPARSAKCLGRFPVNSFGTEEERTRRFLAVAAAGLMFTRFRKGADTVYFLVNQSGRTVSESLAPSCTPKSAWRMDPLTGEIEPLAVGGGKVTLTLDVGHSCILWCSPEATTVRTELAPRLWLDLGEVVGDESVRVTVNGKFLGTLIMPPYRIAIPDGVLKGRRIEDNDIVLDVCERGANRIRDLDRQGVKWKIFTDINMVDIGYNPFDAANWPVQKHGVKGPVRIVAP